VPRVWGDEGHFRDIFTSLLFNACHAMPEGGQLTISSYRITRAVVVEIEDDGIGMSEDTLEHSLESFFSMNPESGAGFGLAWVNALMEKHGGVMRVTSEENEGTKVHLRFAIYDGDEATSEDTTVDLMQHAPLRIMVVDDEKVATETLAACLEADNHAVKTASNGFEALEMMRSESFDLIISDHAMSECDGEEFAQRLQQRGGKEKFILATGAGDRMIAECRRIPGVDLILPKPITREALRKAIVESGVYLTA
jgi:CheY-like chemotaxis protein